MFNIITRAIYKLWSLGTNRTRLYALTFVREQRFL